MSLSPLLAVPENKGFPVFHTLDRRCGMTGLGWLHAVTKAATQPVGSFPGRMPPL